MTIQRKFHSETQRVHTASPTCSVYGKAKMENDLGLCFKRNCVCAASVGKSNTKLDYQLHGQ